MSSYNSPENLARVKSIAETIESVCSGDLYRDEEGTDWNCMEYHRYQCEEDAKCYWEYDEDSRKWERTGGRLYEDEEQEDDPIDEWEQVSISKYFDDVYNIEYRVSGPHDDPRSVCIMVACGGPNIYVDTDTKAVKLYWWGDRASYPLSEGAVMEIDEYFTEFWQCQQ